MEKTYIIKEIVPKVRMRYIHVEALDRRCTIQHLKVGERAMFKLESSEFGHLHTSEVLQYDYDEEKDRYEIETENSFYTLEPAKE